MDDYLNKEMVEAIEACGFGEKTNAAVRQILMRERSEKDLLSANDRETIDQYDRIIDEAVSGGMA